MKAILASVAIIISALFIHTNVQAGGCCYKSVSISPGIAGGLAGQFTVSFYDPGKMPAAELLANKPIQIRITNPWPGQMCTLASQTTNDAGEVSGTCTSPSANAVRISFTSSALSEDDNKKLSNAIQEVPFTAGPNTTSAPAPLPSAKPQAEVTNTPTPATATPQPAMEATDKELEELVRKVDELQETVNTQNEQLNSIQKLINQILSFFTRIFNR